jgi:hypothetical protein
MLAATCEGLVLSVSSAVRTAGLLGVLDMFSSIVALRHDAGASTAHNPAQRPGKGE